MFMLISNLGRCITVVYHDGVQIMNTLKCNSVQSGWEIYEQGILSNQDDLD